MRQRELPGQGDIRKILAEEDGKFYRRTVQASKPVLAHVQFLRDKVNEAPAAGNPNGWGFVGSIPWPLLLAWLQKHHYGIDQFARNEGGAPKVGVTNYHKDKGVKAQFLKYFFTREFSKLHTQHSTTRKASNQFVVPGLGSG